MNSIPFNSDRNILSIINHIARAGLVILLLILSVIAGPNISAQSKSVKQRRTTKLDTHKGYITVNDITYGYGLSNTNVPYSGSYIGFTTIQGYQINKNFVFAGGVGFHIYDAGKAIPLFLDFQYRFYTTRTLTSFAFADGGFLFKIGNEDKTSELFVNPGIGVRHDFSKDLGGNLGIGIMVQQGTIRNSFVNIKLGVTIKP